MNKKITIIGCGNLGQSILKGLIGEKGFDSKNIIATKRNVGALKEFEKLGVQVSSDNAFAIQQSEIIIVALKPHNILSILKDLKDNFNPAKHILVSLATGISIEELKTALEMEISIFRAMPNTAADVKESLTCICTNSTKSEDLETVQYFFNLVGDTIIIDENLMESATVLGACGIAFVLRFIRAMIQGGIEIGFDAKTASTIVNQTVKGAAELLITRKAHPEFEIDKVTTPKGCTIVGLNEMEHNGFSSALIKGIISSFEKIEK